MCYVGYSILVSFVIMCKQKPITLYFCSILYIYCSVPNCLQKIMSAWWGGVGWGGGREWA